VRHEWINIGAYRLMDSNLRCLLKTRTMIGKR
jgi:hypothetical protein